MLLEPRALTLRFMDQRVTLLFVVALLGGSLNAAAAEATAALPDQSHSHVSSLDLRLPGIRERESDHEILLRNTDALVGARLWLTPGKKQPAFVYVDVGATDSSLRWQGLAGVHGSHGIDLLGGWRHVTYHNAPGSGFDSIDFDGPFLGATLAL